MKGKRLLAGVIDFAVLAVWTAAVLAGAWALDAYTEWNRLLLALAASALIVVPAVFFFAAQESSRKMATWGKRAVRLTVREARRGRMRFGRALVRNTFKVAVPLIFISLAVITAVARPGLDTWIVIGVAALFPAVYLLGAFLGKGRTLYDFALGTRVTPALGRRAIVPEDFDENDEGEETIILPRRAIPLVES
ncbi:MAG: RDD family protein [Propionibacteriaceae bacterium]|nr:RDD family protein [Propionibacteriaceae bacterium]